MLRTFCIAAHGSGISSPVLTGECLPCTHRAGSRRANLPACRTGSGVHAQPHAVDRQGLCQRYSAPILTWIAWLVVLIKNDLRKHNSPPPTDSLLLAVASGQKTNTGSLKFHMRISVTQFEALCCSFCSSLFGVASAADKPPHQSHSPRMRTISSCTQRLKSAFL